MRRPRRARPRPPAATIAALVERVRFMEGTERETTLRRLEAENAELRTKVGQATHMARSNKVTGLFRGCRRGPRQARGDAEPSARKY